MSIRIENSELIFKDFAEISKALSATTPIREVYLQSLENRNYTDFLDLVANLGTVVPHHPIKIQAACIDLDAVSLQDGVTKELVLDPSIESEANHSAIDKAFDFLADYIKTVLPLTKPFRYFLVVDTKTSTRSLKQVTLEMLLADIASDTRLVTRVAISFALPSCPKPSESMIASQILDNPLFAGPFINTAKAWQYVRSIKHYAGRKVNYNLGPVLLPTYKKTIPAMLTNQLDSYKEFFKYVSTILNQHDPISKGLNDYLINELIKRCKTNDDVVDKTFIIHLQRRYSKYATISGGEVLIEEAKRL